MIMSLIKELKIDKLKVEIYDTRKSMGEKAAEQVSYKIKELLAKQSEVNI
jgi:glucosamine-6-phosphate deaminase